jgi:chorismate mutase
VSASYDAATAEARGGPEPRAVAAPGDALAASLAAARPPREGAMSPIETVKYVVKKDDNLWNITKANGFPAKDWEKIYKASYNKDLRKTRPDPNVIHAGDVVFLPRSRPQDLEADAKKISELEKKLEEVVKRRKELTKKVDALKAKQKVDKKKIADITKEANNLESIADDAYACANSFDWREIAGCGIWGDKTMREVRELRKEVKALEKKSELDDKTKKKLQKLLSDGKKETEKLQREVSKQKASLKQRIANPYE